MNSESFFDLNTQCQEIKSELDATENDIKFCDEYKIDITDPLWYKSLQKRRENLVKRYVEARRSWWRALDEQVM